MKKISATQLEIIRQYMDDEITYDKMIEKLTTKYDSTAMNIGKIIHSAVEKTVKQLNDSNSIIEIGDYKLLRNQVIYLKSMLNPYNLTEVKEYRIRRKVYVEDVEWLLIGQADLLLPNEIVDLKTTNYIDIEKYINSIQWKVYTMIFKIPYFRYCIANIKVTIDKTIDINEVTNLKLESNKYTEKEIYNMLLFANSILNKENLSVFNLSAEETSDIFE